MPGKSGGKTGFVSFLAANHPNITGYAIAPYVARPTAENPDGEGWVVGKRKPYLVYKGNEEKVKKYEKAFEELKEKYKGIPYRETFKALIPDSVLGVV